MEVDPEATQKTARDAYSLWLPIPRLEKTALLSVSHFLKAESNRNLDSQYLFTIILERLLAPKYLQIICLN